MDNTLTNLSRTVQHNCNISDACYAGSYTMCVYLLKMREYFRWEKGYCFDTPLDTPALGRWLNQREKLWQQLAHQSFQSLLIGGQHFGPFETEQINQQLLEQGYIYSGGIGGKAIPHFFLADHEEQRTHRDYRILIAAKEYARDLTAPPGLSLGKTIFIRKESLRRMLWEKLSEWRWNKPRNAMASALSYYNFDGDLHQALAQMTAVETETIILHEIGEQKAKQYLPADWYSILKQCNASRLELLVRAVKDHLADCLSLLPELLAPQRAASLHFYIANLSAMHKAIFPSLLESYQHWVAHGDSEKLQALVPSARKHWQETLQTLASSLQHPSQGTPQLEELIAHHAC